MSDNLLAPTREIIRCCDALLSEADGKLNEEQQRWVKAINYAAGKPFGTSDRLLGMVAIVHWFDAEVPLDEEKAVDHLTAYARTPMTMTATYLDLLIKSQKQFGDLTRKQQDYIEQIQVSLGRIQTELDRILTDMRTKRGEA